MERKRRRDSLLCFLLLLVLVTGCRTPKNVDAGNIKGDITIDELVKMQAFTPTLMNLSSKLKIKARVGEKELSVGGTLGIEENKGIQIGITALGLFEVARMELTPSSALLINKVEDEYASLGSGTLGILQQAGLSYEVLQAIFTNVPFLSDGSDMRKTLSQMDISRVGNDITLVTPKRGTTQYTFYLDALTGELQQTSGTYNQSVKVDCYYSDFTELEGRSFPRKIQLNVQGAGTPITLDLTLSNIREGKFRFKSTDTKSMKQIDVSRIINVIK